MKIKVFFDYTCPFCYIGFNYLEKLLPNYPDIQLDLYPVEAHPFPEPKTKFREEGKHWNNTLIPLAQKAGLEINYPAMPINYTNKAIEGFLYLQDHGASYEDLNTYTSRMFSAAYVEQKDMADLATILSATEGLNVNTAILKSDLESGKYSAAQKQLNTYAYGEMKVEVLPTLIYNDTRLEAQLGVGIEEDALKAYLDSLTA